MSAPTRARRPRPARRRRVLLVRVLGALAIAAALFAVGVAVGEALHDNPRPGVTTTSVTTLNP